jgi:molecular chaperone DnaK (HSP70)
MQNRRPGNDRYIAVDFGNSTTKLACLAGGPGHEVSLLPVPGFSCRVPVPGQPGRTVPVVPSLIHYTPEGQCLAGSEVTAAGLADDPGTVRWMSRFLHGRSPARFRVQGRMVSYQEAASDFLVRILSSLREEQGWRDAGLVFAIPPGGSGDPGGWLADLAEMSGYASVRVIDSPTAAAAACLPGIRQGDPFMLIDIGGDRTEVSIVTTGWEDGLPSSRILGSASSDAGGALIDRWFSEEVVARAGLDPGDRGAVSPILPACRTAKEALSCTDRTVIPVTGSAPVTVTQADLARVLESRGFSGTILSTIDRALNSAFSRGYTEQTLTAVILAGGTCEIPFIADLVKTRFASLQVIADQPLDTVVRGAAVSSCGVSRADRILSGYAVRVWDPATGTFTRKTLVRPGTPVPSDGPVARIRIQATYDGQARMGIPLYELQGIGRDASGPSLRELVMSPSGFIEVSGNGDSREEPAESRWINERSMTLIPVDPPGVRGEPRLEVWFTIDAARVLRASARDIRTGKLVMENHPVAELR